MLTVDTMVAVLILTVVTVLAPIPWWAKALAWVWLLATPSHRNGA